eukprot:CAMPEP_0119131066 /NCGR_PEP_ID=MMETSP1310-20130426/9365_1 /TAXON_ID=464262 /ORGANISM="Genus nov. species nov., Strain RCC2339" /LENGTH=68 /DNA_ID=CAMNT_0007121619 /DNA_START=165 /DNA_END=371 /DNA_ORIENTATION=+
MNSVLNNIFGRNSTMLAVILFGGMFGERVVDWSCRAFEDRYNYGRKFEHLRPELEKRFQQRLLEEEDE